MLHEAPGDRSLDGLDASPTEPRSRALVARENGAKSRGPKTSRGKAVASRNAMRHGLTARAVVLPGVESTEDWTEHRRGIVASLSPIGALETELAERVALLTWRLRRVVRVETATIAGQIADAEPQAVAKARPRPVDFDPDELLLATLDPDACEDTLATLRSDAEVTRKSWLRYRELAHAREAGADDALDPGDVERLVYDLAEQANADVAMLDTFAPDWGTRRWTATTVVDLARGFARDGDEATARDLLLAVALASTTAMDHARRRLADAERLRIRYTAERQLPTMREDVLERYEGHLQRQLASTLAMLRGVRETFPSTG